MRAAENNPNVDDDQQNGNGKNEVNISIPHASNRQILFVSHS